MIAAPPTCCAYAHRYEDNSLTRIPHTCTCTYCSMQRDRAGVWRAPAYFEKPEPFVPRNRAQRRALSRSKGAP
jgi:hypothetical protein